MVFFSQRKELEQAYMKWLEDNPTVKDCPFSCISFLSGLFDDELVNEFLNNN